MKIKKGKKQKVKVLSVVPKKGKSRLKFPKKRTIHKKVKW